MCCVEIVRRVRRLSRRIADWCPSFGDEFHWLGELASATFGAARTLSFSSWILVCALVRTQPRPARGVRVYVCLCRVGVRPAFSTFVSELSLISRVARQVFTENRLLNIYNVKPVSVHQTSLLELENVCYGCSSVFSNWYKILHSAICYSIIGWNISWVTYIARESSGRCFK